MSLFEAPAATWEKRLMQKHYNYRDSNYPSGPNTTVLFAGSAPQIQSQLMALYAAEAVLPNGPWTVYYPFGYNARNWTTAVPALTAAGLAGTKCAWPNAGEFASGTVGERVQCYAREVMIYVTEDTWVRFVSLNPIYITLLAQQSTTEQIAVMGCPQLIIEVEHFVAAGDKDTFYPTYGVSMIFRADSVAGSIYISAEGNAEGGE